MDIDTAARPRTVSGRFRLAALVGVAALVVIGIAVPAQAGAGGSGGDGSGDHCLAVVVGQEPDGELTVSPANCYTTFSAAMFVASAGTWRLPVDAPVTVLESTTAGVHTGGFETLMGSSSVLAVHYDYYNGGGSSITIRGSGCYGYWNTWTSWDNRISSTYNGCYKTKHFDWPNVGGSSATFSGHYLWNITGFMNNRTESILYANW